MECLRKEWKLNRPESDFSHYTINLYPELEQQTILGFGGAFTEASAYNYAQMSASDKETFLEAYFGKTGTHYQIGRVAMGSCDFALAPYSESTKEDLSDFNIEQDTKYIIPMVKDALRKADGNLFLFASPWSPPAFMKDNGELNNGGSLKPEFYQTYAEYFVKFLLAYRAEGIRISAVSVQNEARGKQTWETCRYTATQEAIFATNFLRPALDRNDLSDIKIIIWDHNKDRILDRAKESFAVPGAKEAIWGMGYHWYSGEYYDSIRLFRQYYPEKEIFATEFCHELTTEMLGNFNVEKRNIDYAREYILSLRFGSAGLCDWNLLLDQKGGPCHWRGKKNPEGCAAAFCYDTEKKKLIEDGIYRSIYTIVSQIDRGDNVIASTSVDQDLPLVAVKKADGSTLLFILNTADKEKTFHIRMGEKGGTIVIPANSLTANRLIPV